MRTDLSLSFRTFVRGAVGVALLSALLGAPGARAASIALTWTAPGDDGQVGRASQYDLRYSETPVSADTAAWWASATLVASLPAPATAGTRESIIVGGLADGRTYYFGIRAADEVPNWSGYSNVALKQTGAPGAPATPTGFQAGLVAGDVRLTWNPFVSTGELGFKLYRGVGGGPALLATLPLATTSYTDTTVQAGTSYEYRLATYTDSLESVPAVATISIPLGGIVEASTEIHGYPNPAKDQVTLRFNLGGASAGGATKITVFDMTGHRIRVLADEVLPPGEHTLAWDCRSERGHALAPGLYNIILDGPAGRSVAHLAIVP